jgi:23S rRNA (guanine745-N1)-methyltransferase
MPRLTCTVRACSLPLVREADLLRCAAGHSFDRAREGHWNLLQPQDRRSAAAGDRLETLLARGRWLARGFADGLTEVVADSAGLDTLPAGAVVLDVGCGDGAVAARLCSGRDVDLCGIDLSTAAARVAARRLPAGTWIVANADRGLPLATASVDLALSVFGRRPVPELARVVRPGGRLVAAVPAEDDLAELREAAQGRTLRRERRAGLLAELADAPFRACGHISWRIRAAHDRDAAIDALTMTYRGLRRSERERLEVRLGTLVRLEVTLAADVLAFARC